MGNVWFSAEAEAELSMWLNPSNEALDQPRSSESRRESFAEFLGDLEERQETCEGDEEHRSVSCVDVHEDAVAKKWKTDVEEIEDRCFIRDPALWSAIWQGSTLRMRTSGEHVKICECDLQANTCKVQILSDGAHATVFRQQLLVDTSSMFGKVGEAFSRTFFQRVLEHSDFLEHFEEERQSLSMDAFDYLATELISESFCRFVGQSSTRPAEVDVVKVMSNDARRMVELGVTVSEKSSPTTALLLAAGFEPHERLTSLLERKLDPNCCCPKDGSTPLHWAVANGRQWACQALLEARANPDAQKTCLLDDGGKTSALHLAVEKGSVRISKLLLNFHASLELKTGSNGLTPLGIGFCSLAETLGNGFAISEQLAQHGLISFLMDKGAVAVGADTPSYQKVIKLAKGQLRIPECEKTFISSKSKFQLWQNVCCWMTRDDDVPYGAEGLIVGALDISQSEGTIVLVVEFDTGTFALDSSNLSSQQPPKEIDGYKIGDSVFLAGWCSRVRVPVVVLGAALEFPGELVLRGCEDGAIRVAPPAELCRSPSGEFHEDILHQCGVELCKAKTAEAAMSAFARLTSRSSRNDGFRLSFNSLKRASPQTGATLDSEMHSFHNVFRSETDKLLSILEACFLGVGLKGTIRPPIPSLVECKSLKDPVRLHRASGAQDWFQGQICLEQTTVLVMRAECEPPDEAHIFLSRALTTAKIASDKLGDAEGFLEILRAVGRMPLLLRNLFRDVEAQAHAGILESQTPNMWNAPLVAIIIDICKDGQHLCELQHCLDSAERWRRACKDVMESMGRVSSLMQKSYKDSKAFQLAFVEMSYQGQVNVLHNDIELLILRRLRQNMISDCKQAKLADMAKTASSKVAMEIFSDLMVELPCACDVDADIANSKGCDKIGLRNHVNFPPARWLPPDDRADVLDLGALRQYYFHADSDSHTAGPSRLWALLAEVVKVEEPGKVLVRTGSDEECRVDFQSCAAESVAAKPGRALIILYPTVFAVKERIGAGPTYHIKVRLADHIMIYEPSLKQTLDISDQIVKYQRPLGLDQKCPGLARLSQQSLMDYSSPVTFRDLCMAGSEDTGQKGISSEGNLMKTESIAAKAPLKSKKLNKQQRRQQQLEKDFASDATASSRDVEKLRASDLQKETRECKSIASLPKSLGTRRSLTDEMQITAAHDVKCTLAEKPGVFVKDGRSCICIRPSDIFFTHDSIRATFKDDRPIQSTLSDLRAKIIDVEVIPELTVRWASYKSWSGRWWTYTGNRRLWVFRQLEAEGLLERIVVQITNLEVPSFRLTTTNGGCNVRVRGLRICRSGPM
eukprot:TRINITY_DN22850_c0_g1_i1.p1 TRINITY_DN22850_c0_g1~~TRINITY_DN22850_c0_g1_i1.p1  ORF type:complete len:1322 (-),score=126.63 TRINITY_DN22850_c0_g1_i1:33-3971(-)